MKPVSIGIDFDNTIVNYDDVFRAVAIEAGVVPKNFIGGKELVKQFLHSDEKYDQWTRLQGYVYGARMSDAKPYQDCTEAIRKLIRKGVSVHVVSHKTKKPFLGEPYDLHLAAWKWLELMGFFDEKVIGLPRTHVFLELTKVDKIDRIRELKLDYFIDDLPELLLEPTFPKYTEKLLFDPANIHRDVLGLNGFASWKQLYEFLTLQTVHSRKQLAEI